MSRKNLGGANFDDHGDGRDHLLPTGKHFPAVSKVSPSFVVPQQISNLGYNATLRFLDFFTANIRNKNTRDAYAVAVRTFFVWLDGRGDTDLGCHSFRASGITVYLMNG